MKRLLITIALTLFCTVAQAAVIQINALPTNSGTGFKHNNFHDATLADGADGVKLGWFDLGVGGGSYDTGTGAFVLNIDIYSDETLSSSIGTAVGTGNLNLLSFNAFDGGLIGFISWDFDASAEGNGLSDTTMNFYDVNYGVSSALNPNYVPNTAFGNHMALWGADGDLDPITGLYTTGTHPTIGVDFVATFVPVPAAAWLFGSGLLALVGISRRKTRC